MKKYEISKSGGQVLEARYTNGAPAEKPGAMQLAGQAVVENFPQILSLAREYMQIHAHSRQTDDEIKKLAELRKQIETDARAYVEKQRSDIDKTALRMNFINDMMMNFYRYGKDAMDSGDFCQAITTAIQNIESF